ncbi:nuclear body protein SP140-like protein isoform X3 [Xyrichtys novacula]|uniref:Nuclear body protein SP140-like protein isoform X3 n=1 Tax=Xyrichtys novacula TaxID=13765 RepID=A0AAV1GR35_XYRNO|nr:nuclear body protein SP140-like protein isoform X3 [Xyrichtys novacula]
MDPLDFLEPEELLRFFHCRKTELSCMEKPLTFINQLRDHNLIPEETYKKMSRMRSKDNIKRALYDLLDWLETEKSQHIKLFWSCVFKGTIMNQYPPLKLMYNSLMDGSYKCTTQVPEKTEKDDGKRRTFSEDENDEELQTVKQKKKRRRKHLSNNEEELSGPSTRTTPSQKTKKINFSPIKKAEEIWNWPIYKTQLPVTCGNKEGMLNRERLAKGEKCIIVGREWFTPSEFERFAERGSCRNWKTSIRCKGTPLKKLLEEGHLKTTGNKGGVQKSKLLITSSFVESESDGEGGDEEEEEEDEDSSYNEEDEAEQQPGVSADSDKEVFEVTCGAENATLHVERFASGICGKSIRTETSWMTPLEFVKFASGQTETSWRKAIKWEGKPLSHLTETNILRIHSLLCSCRLCKPDHQEIENQNNDDMCCICKSIGKLVACDGCPRSFHQKCHLPHIDDATLGDDRRWMCTFCVFKTNREWMYGDALSREAVMVKDISQHEMGCQYLILYLCCADEEQTFTSNPRLYASLKNYTNVIDNPMWLEKIADKLQRRLYQTIGEFVSDVQLIFSNCALFNQENSEYLTSGNRLKDLFEEELKKVFNISE